MMTASAIKQCRVMALIIHKFIMSLIAYICMSSSAGPTVSHCAARREFKVACGFCYLHLWHVHKVHCPLHCVILHCNIEALPLTAPDS